MSRRSFTGEDYVTIGARIRQQILAHYPPPRVRRSTRSSRQVLTPSRCPCACTSSRSPFSSSPWSTATSPKSGRTTTRLTATESGSASHPRLRTHGPATLWSWRSGSGSWTSRSIRRWDRARPTRCSRDRAMDPRQRHDAPAPWLCLPVLPVGRDSRLALPLPEGAVTNTHTHMMVDI